MKVWNEIDDGDRSKRMRMEKVMEDMMTMGFGGDGVAVKVMTDEQIEILREQISVYATICEKLVEMHNSMTAIATRQSTSLSSALPGMRMCGSIYNDPTTMTSSWYGYDDGRSQIQQQQYRQNMVTARQRWNPTTMQLQILEGMFKQGNGTPNKVKIKEITFGLLQHGEISETNVYNWFQNRRARFKRKRKQASITTDSV